MKIAFKLAVVLLIASCPGLLLAEEGAKVDAAPADTSIELTDGVAVVDGEDGTVGMSKLELQPPEKVNQQLTNCLFFENVRCFREGERCNCETAPGEPKVCFCTEFAIGGLNWKCY